jgi:hypothetical protein
MSRQRLVLLVVLLALSAVVFAQDGPVTFTATAIGSQGRADSMSARVNIQVASYTPTAERQKLVNTLQQNPGAALAMLHNSTRGYINIEGHPGRTIEAAYWLDGADGRRLVLIAEHQLSALEKERGVKQEDFPLAVAHIDVDRDGVPVSGEFFPAVSLAVTPAGILDVQASDFNKVILIDLKRQKFSSAP